MTAGGKSQWIVGIESSVDGLELFHGRAVGYDVSQRQFESLHWSHGHLHFMHYNYCRIHQTLRVTPAMAAGLTDHVWELEELVGLLH